MRVKTKHIEGVKPNDPPYITEVYIAQRLLF
jgi:hypothetical protein